MKGYWNGWDYTATENLGNSGKIYIWVVRLVDLIAMKKTWRHHTDVTYDILDTREHYCIGDVTSLSHLLAVHYIYYQLSTTYQPPTTYLLTTYYLLPITCYLPPTTLLLHSYYTPTTYYYLLHSYHLQSSSHMTAHHKRNHAITHFVLLFVCTGCISISHYTSSVMMHQIIFWPPGYVRHCYLFTTFSRLILLSLSGSKLLHARRRLLPFVNHTLVHILVFVNCLPLCLLSRQGSDTYILHLQPVYFNPLSLTTRQFVLECRSIRYMNLKFICPRSGDRLHRSG